MANYYSGRRHAAVMRNSARRNKILIFIFGFWIIALFFRLVRIQVVDHDFLATRARRNTSYVFEVAPRRGEIIGRRGWKLAQTMDSKSLLAYPARISNPSQTAKALSSILGQDVRDIENKLSRHDRFLIFLKRALTPRERKSVESLRDSGLEFSDDLTRVYPGASLATHVVGDVDIDLRGITGLESTFDGNLRGKPARSIIELDATGRAYDDYWEESPANDSELTTTIDEVLQMKLEILLESACKELRAATASAIVLAPDSGEVLALANAPSFDPNSRPRAGFDSRVDRAVEVIYEPGSVLSFVTCAAGLEERVIALRPVANGSDKGLRIGLERPRLSPADRDSFRTIRKKYSLFDRLTGWAIASGLIMGKDRVAEYVDRFGLTRRTGIELPAEASGRLLPLRLWDERTHVAIAVGHNISTSAVELVSAVAAIANKGESVQPHLVTRMVGVGGSVIDRPTPIRRQIVTTETSTIVTRILEQEFEKWRGLIGEPSLLGVPVACAIGSSSKLDEATRRYSKTRYMTSALGFLPDNKGGRAIIVVFDQTAGTRAAEKIAARTFCRIAKATLGGYDLPVASESPSPPSPEGN